MATARSSAIEVPSEYGALLSTRRWLIVIGAVLVCGLTLVLGLIVFPDISSAEHAIMVASGFLLVVGLVGGGKQGRQWALLLAVAVLLLGVLVADDSTIRWIPLNALVAYAAYFVVVVSSRVVGLAACLVGALALPVLWSRHPGSVIVGDLASLNGWFSMLQVAASSLFLWWSWNSLKAEAMAADQSLLDVEARTAEAIRVQERARMWRSAAVRLHESILNTIRYVLMAPQVDRARLEADVARARGMGRPVVALRVDSIGGIVDALGHDPEGSQAVSVAGWIPDTPLDPVVFEAVRAAAVELVRNAVRHGGATAIEVTAGTNVDGRLQLRLVDDGVGPHARNASGVGTSTLTAALAEVGARWSREPRPQGGSISRIWIPRPGEQLADDAPHRSFSPFDSGRLLVTSVLAGIVAAGALLYLGMALTGSLPERVAGILGLFGAVVAVGLVARRRRIPPSIAVALVLAPALVPWFLLSGDYACKVAAPLSPVLTIAGYTVMIIAAWSGRLPGVVGLSIWAVSGALLVQKLPGGCRDSVALALVGSLVALPIILSVAYAGAHGYRRAQEAALETRQREIREQTTAAAALDINNQLDSSVREAEATVVQIVDGAGVDAAVRSRLERLDARIRAGIQVDPQSDGGLAVLAKALVDEVSDQGTRVAVLAITCSQDARPLPAEVQRLLSSVLAVRLPVPARLRVFTDGEQDHLSVVTSREALRVTGLRPGSESRWEDVVVEVEEEAEEETDDSDGRFAILVSRPITPRRS